MNVISRMTSDYQQRSSDQESSSVKNTPSDIKPKKSGNKISSPYILAGILSLAITGLSVYFWASIPPEQHKPRQAFASPTKTVESSKEIQNTNEDIAALNATTDTTNNTKSNSDKKGLAKEKMPGQIIKPVKPLPQKNIPVAKPTAEKKPASKPAIKKMQAVVTKKQASHTKTHVVRKAIPTATKAKTHLPRKQASAATSRATQNEDKGEMHKTINTLSNPQLAQQTFIAAIKLLKRKEFKKTEEYLNTALEFDPQHVQARETLAGMFIGKRQNDKAITLLTEGMSRNPDYFKFRLLLAQTYIDVNNEGQALTTLLDAPEELKTSGQYHSMIAVIQQNLGMYKDAIDSYQQALKIQPNESRWWLGIGLTYEYDEQYKQAEQAYLRASQIGNLGKDILQYIDVRLHSVRLHITPTR